MKFKPKLSASLEEHLSRKKIPQVQNRHRGVLFEYRPSLRAGSQISGGEVAGFVFVINLFDLGGNKKLKDDSYFTESLIEFPGH